jgi:tetratricopeptide (TPR) repeat protein
MQPFLLAIFLLGYVLLATLGAWTRLAFQWPAYLVLAVGGLLALFRLRKGFRFSPSSLCLLSTLLFAGYCAARAWFSPVEYLARQDLLPLAACLVGYTLFALHVEHPRYRRWFAVVLTVLVLANFGIGVYQAQYDRTWSPYHWLGYARATGPANAGGFFHSENHLAGFLEGSLYFLAAFALFARIKLVWRMMALFALMLGLVVLVLTYSRAGIASAGVGLAAFGVLSLWLFGKFLGPQFWKYLAAFGVLFVLLGSFLVFLCRDFLTESYRTTGGVWGDGQFRMAYTQMALRQWETSPVWGTGARTFGMYAREFTTRDEDWNGAQEVDPDIAHNDYAQLLGDYGAVGFALGMLLLLAHLGNGLRFLAWYRNVRFERTGDLFSNSLALALGAVSAVCAYVAHTAIDFNLHIPANALMMAAVFGLLANPGFEADGRRHLKIPGLKTALTLATALGAGWTLWLGWRAAPAELAFQQGVTRTHVADYLGALTPHRRAAELDPAHQPNRMAFGTAYVGLAGEEEIPALATSWREKAIEQFRAAVALNPRDALALINLAEQLSTSGQDRFEEAEALYLEAIRRAPALTAFRGRYGFHLLRHGKAAEAADVWEETFKRKWFNADSLVARDLLNKIREAQKPAVPAPAPADAPAPAVAPEAPPAAPVPTPPEAPPAEAPAPAAVPAPAPRRPEPAPERAAGGLLSLPDPSE